jgi:hypothetical protein
VCRERGRTREAGGQQRMKKVKDLVCDGLETTKRTKKEKHSSLEIVLNLLCDSKQTINMCTHLSLSLYFYLSHICHSQFVWVIGPLSSFHVVFFFSNVASTQCAKKLSATEFSFFPAKFPQQFPQQLPSW